jgi:long-chain acyl-CoA synthetase
LNQPGEEVIGTVGKPLDNTEIELWDANDQITDVGQIVARGPQVMSGYWNMPEETALVLTPERFFKTGDVGMRMPDGCIKIVDRLKDLILVSGFNVYPNEIEEILSMHPSIIEAAVVGKEDEKTGERVCAYITVNQEITKQEIVNFCKEQLTAYKVPKEIVVMAQLPKSTVGKILRRELR